MNTKSIERITFFRPLNQMLRFYQFLLMTAIYLPQQETMAEKAAGMAWVLASCKPADPSQMAEPSEDSVWVQV